jgi:peroxiredoxin
MSARNSTPPRSAATSPGANQRARVGRGSWMVYGAIGLAVAAVIGVLSGVYRGSASDSFAGSGSYAVGDPGPGAPAPAFDLAASTGGRLSLSALRGNTVLLYFQEGLTCQPCWDQLGALESDASALKSAGIDRVVSITTDPIKMIKQKVADDGLTTSVLSDPDLAISRAYHANAYGMMGTSRDGHTFILVGPDGTIRWRADYGGAPNYTMFVPVDKLLAQLKAGRP